jgi:hypothetical protein
LPTSVYCESGNECSDEQTDHSQEHVHPWGTEFAPGHQWRASGGKHNDCVVGQNVRDETDRTVGKTISVEPR